MSHYYSLQTKTYGKGQSDNSKNDCNKKILMLIGPGHTGIGGIMSTSHIAKLGGWDISIYDV